MCDCVDWLGMFIHTFVVHSSIAALRTCTLSPVLVSPSFFWFSHSSVSLYLHYGCGSCSHSPNLAVNLSSSSPPSGISALEACSPVPHYFVRKKRNLTGKLHDAFLAWNESGISIHSISVLTDFWQHLFNLWAPVARRVELIFLCIIVVDCAL